VICEPWNVVVVPFPFVERVGTKRRPALVLSEASFNEGGSTILAMITTTAHQPWPGDTPIVRLDEAGLNVSCLVRLKLFTLDNRLIARRIGRLSPLDQEKTAQQLHLYLA
jgi:mRNA-degrading endonuclease toxin of MazEF toxin-antitoxin module